MLSEHLVVRHVGQRYLRLDRKVEGYARLSPSILREFLTYSVVGLRGQPDALRQACRDVREHAHAVSHAKLELAKGLIAGVAARLAEREAATAGLQQAGGRRQRGEAAGARFCVFIAGDVVYDMAHDVPRPERSTGKMVRGSDLDLVVIVDDAAPESLVQQFDEQIYHQKYRHLINPSAREEVDYIVKRLGRLREQAGFRSFKDMVACKILDEGVFLHGDRALFQTAKELLALYGVSQRLQAMQAEAARRREEAERYLLTTDQARLRPDQLHLFYTTDESEEFE